MPMSENKLLLQETFSLLHVHPKPLNIYIKICKPFVYKAICVGK